MWIIHYKLCAVYMSDHLLDDEMVNQAWEYSFVGTESLIITVGEKLKHCQVGCSKDLCGFGKVVLSLASLCHQSN